VIDDNVAGGTQFDPSRNRVPRRPVAEKFWRHKPPHALNFQFSERLQYAAHIQAPRAKINLFTKSRICETDTPISSQPRGVRVVTYAGRDAVDVRAAQDDRSFRGRRSRVVLAPRRWSQASRDDREARVARKPGSPGRARRKPLKPLRGESRIAPVGPVVDYARVFFTRGRGCNLHPAFPAPSDFSRDTI